MTTVEHASIGDVGAVLDLWTALVESQRAHGAHLHGEANRSTARDFIAEYVAMDQVLVAREQGRIVGFVMFHVERGVYEEDVVRGVVDNVFVASDARSRGVGTALLDAAEDALADDGATVVALSVLADNEAARRLYERRGYRPHRVELERPLETDTHTNPDG